MKFEIVMSYYHLFRVREGAACSDSQVAAKCCTKVLQIAVSQKVVKGFAPYFSAHVASTIVGKD